MLACSSINYIIENDLAFSSNGLRISPCSDIAKAPYEVNDKTLIIPLGMSFRDIPPLPNFAPSGAGFV
jgi:hypothetical protein